MLRPLAVMLFISKALLILAKHTKDRGIVGNEVLIVTFAFSTIYLLKHLVSKLC
jgi:hypothetical protein